MNWTGGRLQRHSTVADSAKIRQKQHFAKVNQNLRNVPKMKSSIKWSILGAEVEPREGSHRGSVLPRRHSKASSRGRSQSLVPNKSSLIASLIQQHREQSIRERSESPAVVERHSRPIKRERVEEEDLYNATPPPKRKRASSEPPSERASSVGHQDEEESMLDKRQKILRKGDWVGVSIQKPLQLAFALPKHKENIGRRRKVSEDHRARFRDAQTRISSPFASRHSRVLELPRHRPNGATSKSDVRISIGGIIVSHGISSSSAYRQGSHSTTTRRRSPTVSSDVMLLDNEFGRARGVPRRARGVPKTLSNPPASSHGSLANRESQHQTSDSHMQKDIEEEQGQFVENPLANGSLPQMETHEPGYQHQGRQHNRNSREASFTDFNSSGDEEARLRFRQGRLIFSSSSASIQHPKPRSTKMSVLVRPDSSDIAESTTAQVGMAVPVVPSSQMLENDDWAAWMMGPEEDEIEFQDVDYNQGRANRAPTPSISPGVSMAPQTQSRRMLEDEGYGEEDSDMESPAFESMVQDMSLHGSQSRSSSPGSGDSSQSLKRDSGISLGQPASAPAGLKATPKPQNGHTLQKPVTEMEEDQDAAWRRFVFPSSSDDEEPENENDYSMRGNPSNGYPETIQSSSSAGNGSAAATYAPTAFETLKHSSHHRSGNRGNGSSDSASAYMAGHGRSVYDREVLRSFTTKSRFRSTKPTSFVGRKVSRDYIPEEIHLGRGLGIDFTGRRRRASDDDEHEENMELHEVESIEDE